MDLPVLSIALVLALLFGGNVAIPSDDFILVSQFFSNSSISQNTTAVRIGTPLTLHRGSRYSDLSRYMAQGYELYFHWLNTERGGVRLNGTYHPVELVLVNDYSSASLARAAAETLIDHYQVNLFLGPVGSPLSDAVAAVVHQRGATMLAPTSNPAVVSGRPQVFTMSSPPAYAEIALSILSQQHPRPTRLAFLQEEDAFAEVCGALVGLASQYSMQIVFNATLPPIYNSTTNSSPISAVVASMAAASPDVMIGCTYQTLCHAVIKEAAQQDWNPKAFLFTSCISSSSFALELLEKAMFILGTTSWNKLHLGTCALTGLTPAQFSTMYEDRFHEIQEEGAAAFSASAVLVHAIELANSIDSTLVANALRTMNVNTIFGQVEFDAIGLNKNALKIEQSGSSAQASMIVAPLSIATGNISYPKPTWFELRCLDPVGGLTLYGYNSGGSTCGNCPIGEAGNFTAMPDGSSRRVCQPCPVGDILQVVGQHATCKKCGQGSFWCGQGWIPPIYGDWVSLQEREEKLCFGNAPSSCLICPRGRYQDEHGQTMCKECTPGKHMNELGGTECRTCTSRTYQGGDHQTFAAHNATITCNECPKGALCKPDADGLYSTYTNADGYYLVKEVAYNTEYPLGRLHQCPNNNGEACLARENCYRDPDTGEVAMEGMFCGNCRSGFAQGEIGLLCSKCPSPLASYLSHFTGQVLIFAITIVLSIMQFMKDPRKIPPTSSVILRQFLNYVQLSTVVLPATQLSDVGERFRDSTEIFQFAFASRGTQTSEKGTECFLKHILPDLKIFESYTLAGLFMVPFWLLADVVFFFLFKGLAMLCGLPQPRPEQLATAITLNLFIVQPRLTKIFLIPFRCQFLDTSRMSIELDVECDSGAAAVWQAVAFLGMVALPIGIPLGLMAVLRYLRIKRKLLSVSSVRVFGFVFQGLRPEYYYFECVNMIRKVVYQIAANVPWLSPSGPDEDLQKALVCVSLVIVSIVFLSLHLRCEPYDSRNFNILHRIEAAILWALLATCMAQAWRYMSDNSWVFLKSTNKERNKGFRDVFCTIVVLACHIRCLGLMAFGVCSTYARHHRWYIYCFGGGADVKVDSGGIHTERLCSSARAVLVDTIRNTTLQQLRSETLDYEVWNDAMRRVCVQALYEQDRNTFFNKHPVLGVVFKFKDVLKKVSPDWVDGYLKRQVTSVSSQSSWHLDPNYEYNPDDIDEASKRVFGVADLQLEAIKLNWQEDSRPSRRTKKSNSKNSSFGILKRMSSSLKAINSGSSRKVLQDPDAGEDCITMQEPTTTSPIPVVIPPPANTLSFGPERIQRTRIERESLLKALQWKEEELAALKKKIGKNHIRLDLPERPSPGIPTTFSDDSMNDKIGGTQEAEVPDVCLSPRSEPPRSEKSDESV